MSDLNKKLVGSQLLNVTEGSITIEKDGKEFFLDLDKDYGGCCGYNEITTKCFYEPNSKRNPIITNVSIDTDYNGHSQECSLTFFGEDKKLAEVNTLSSSGSGWGYGASVTLKCKDLDIDELLSEW